MSVTLTAFGPLSPSADSKLTRAPSRRVRIPSELIAVWWTNRSRPPPSGVMKPNPFSSLNHFTVPVGIPSCVPPLLCLPRGGTAQGTRSRTVSTAYLLPISCRSCGSADASRNRSQRRRRPWADARTVSLLLRAIMSQTFEPLFDPAAAGREGVSAEELAERLFGELSEETATPSGRPYLLLNMIASVDGRITSEGRSGPLGGPADRELFHALRTVADGVLVGARTVRVERYNRIVAEERHRRLRAARGLDEEPYACVLTASGSFDRRIPLYADGCVR